MGRGYQKTILCGNLGADPELRYTQSGKAVCNLRVAVTTGGRDRERTEWFRVVAWEQLAELCDRYLQKGSRVFVEGALQSRTWTDRQGVERTSLELHARECLFLGGTEQAPGAETTRGWRQGSDGSTQDPQGRWRRAGERDVPDEHEDDEEIPF